YNVVPSEAKLTGTLRWFDDGVGALMRERMKKLCDGIAAAHEIDIELKLWNVFDVLMNDEGLSHALADAARDVTDPAKVSVKSEVVMGSEDMADMLRVVPGAYCTVGHGGDVPLHNPGFILDDAILPVGASLLARLVETRGAAA
ncbi:MAG: M20/M25/M40 family metallo-hydrolase, partial [Rubrimonas sp.]